MSYVTAWNNLKAIVKAYFTSGRVEFLKCDTKACLHVEFHQRLTLDMAGKTCPVCGGVLLTREDYMKFSLTRGQRT